MPWYWPFKRKPKFRVIYLVVMDDHTVLEAGSQTPAGPRMLEVTEYPADVPAPEGVRLRWDKLPLFRRQQIEEGMLTLTWKQIRFHLEDAGHADT